MLNRYLQVVRAYLRWWPLWVDVALATVFAAVVFVFAPPAEKAAGAPTIMTLAGLLWAVVGGAAVVTTHLKSQLADPRSHLFPHFRAPHLTVGAIAMLVLTFGFAVPVVMRVGLSSLGATSLVALVVGSTAWWMHVQSFTIGLAVNALWLSLLDRRVAAAAVDVVYGRNDGVALLLLATGAASLVALWIRLSRLHEAMPEYARRPTTSRPGAAAGDFRFESFIRGPVQTRCIAAANLWRRVGHLRATGLGRLSWLMAGGLVASILFVPLLSGGGNTPAAGALEAFLVVTGMLPPLLVFSHWSRRWPALGYESLRPATRKNFVREVGLAVALDLAEAWAALMLAVLFAVAVWDARGAMELASSGFLVLTAATSVVLFGVNGWVLRLRNPTLSLVALVLSGLAPLAPMFGVRIYAGTGWITPLSLGLLAIGALVTVDAYARWCRTDLE